MPAQARMFPTEFTHKSVCFDNFSEAVQFHQEVLGEYPIGKGWINNKNGPSFAAIMVNPVKPSWTLLNFHKSNEGGVIVCAITGGSQWEVITPGSDSEKFEL